MCSRRPASPRCLSRTERHRKNHAIQKRIAHPRSRPAPGRTRRASRAAKIRSAGPAASIADRGEGVAARLPPNCWERRRQGLARTGSCRLKCGMASDLKEAGGLTRLFVTAALEPGANISLDEGQTHYLLHVLRAKAGDRVLMFNGRDGEWQAGIATASKRAIVLTVGARTLAQMAVPDLWLAFAPVKKTPSDYLTQKATELGVSKLQPVFSRRTIVTRLNEERLLANSV